MEGLFGEKVWVYQARYDALIESRLRLIMVIDMVKKALAEDDNYISTEKLALILGVEKEKKDETKGTDN